MWTTLTHKRRRKRPADPDGTAAAHVAEFDGNDQQLAAEIDRLTEANRTDADGERERELLLLRNLLGVRWLDAAGDDAGLARPDDTALPSPSEGLPELKPAQLTPGLIRAGILRDGCVLVRGLVSREQAQRFAAQIERSFVERERHDADRSFNDRYYIPFEPDPRRGVRLMREWIKEGGGVLAVDSPLLSFEMGELYRAAGMPELVRGYLGEAPMVTGHKTTLRKAEPQVGGAWHQDGKFMGHVKALNLWLSLSHCGDDAPGLDLVPRRLDEHVTTETDETMLPNQVSQRIAEEAAGGRGILRPIFEPGDALLFDELFLHKTASDPTMSKPRYAIENWFFGASAFPGDYVPLAL
jgi:phytanoyl-CoA dioxygenase PhyH